MSNAPAKWYFPSDAREPAGPFTDEEVHAKYERGEIREPTLCWNEEMPSWQPLAEVEPFRSIVRGGDTDQLLRFRCQCGNDIAMSRKFAGRRARCDKCGSVVQVPAESSAADMPPAEKSALRSKPRRAGDAAKPSAVVGVVLVALVVSACVATLVTSWADIPQPPGSAVARGILSLIFPEETVSSVSGAVPAVERWFWLLPAGY